MKTLFLTNEYPPHIYGGAGVHVDYLSRELARLIDLAGQIIGIDIEHLPESDGHFDVYCPGLVNPVH